MMKLGAGVVSNSIIKYKYAYQIKNINEHRTMLNRRRVAPTAAANAAVRVSPCPICVKKSSFADHVWST